MSRGELIGQSSSGGLDGDDLCLLFVTTQAILSLLDTFLFCFHFFRNKHARTGGKYLLMRTVRNAVGLMD